MPGTDGSGMVAAAGARIRRFAVGDPVYATGFLNPFARGGFYAEYVDAGSIDAQSGRRPRVTRDLLAGGRPLSTGSNPGRVSVQ